MKIVADDQILLLDALFEGHVLVKKPGAEIRRADLLDAQCLWVRTVTAVNAELLQGTAVRFVGTATAGYDHLDTKWLTEQGIRWGYAPGANASAVAEYVLCCIAALRSRGLLQGARLRAGVIGVGRVGSQVAALLSAIGFEVLQNDPPRAQCEESFHSTPLDQFENLDLICIHASLTRDGRFPSYHLLSHDFLQRQKTGCVLLNAARGALIDTDVLLRQPHLHLCLDVWENEPEINLDLLRRACIATPHIAGYSLQAKRLASVLLYEQMRESLGFPEVQCLALKSSALRAASFAAGANWEEKALAVEDLFARTEEMREVLLKDTASVGHCFSELRRHYPLRKSIATQLSSF